MMYDAEKIGQGFGYTYSKEPLVMDTTEEGRHFCAYCGKLIRDGQLFMYQGRPLVPLSRPQRSYWHDECENRGE